MKIYQTEFKKKDSTTVISKSKSGDYELEIEVHKEFQNGDETWLQTGTIKLKYKSGKVLTKKFYGECGC